MPRATITLTNDPRQILVDARDRKRLEPYRWHIDYRGRIRSNLRGNRPIPQVELRHLVLAPRRGRIVGHLNGDPLDCRRQNLAYMTRSEQLLRIDRQPRSQSGLRGVSADANGRYRAGLMFKGVRYHLGRFDTAEEASRAYEAARRRLMRA
ncbi:MAG: HNH endonuclease [Chloroflexia bacterium]